MQLVESLIDGIKFPILMIAFIVCSPLLMALSFCALLLLLIEKYQKNAAGEKQRIAEKMQQTIEKAQRQERLQLLKADLKARATLRKALAS